MAVAWVTGASSGLGRQIALALHEAGWQVIGGARSFNDETQQAFTCLPLDVRDEQSVAAFVQAAAQKYGPPGVVVNAAGILTLGACEYYSMQELTQVMDVNFYGMVRMVQAVLPLMREQGSGRIVNLSSINGLMAVPFQGAYTASKHAIEGFSEALMMETAPFGIQVMLVEPGDHRGGKQQYRTSSVKCGDCYTQSRKNAAARIAKDEAGGASPEILGKKVARALGKKRLPPRLRVAQPAQHAAVVLHDILPNRLFMKILSMYYGIK